MAAREFDVIKVEKARSLRLYGRGQRLKAFLRVSVFCIPLLLLVFYSSGSSLSATVTSDSLGRVVVLFARPLSVFLLSNAIIITVIILSGKNTERGPVRDVYDEYLARQRTFARNCPAKGTLPEETVVNGQIILYSSPPVGKNLALTVTNLEADRNKAIVEVTETIRVVERLPVVPLAKQCRRPQTTVTARVQRELRLSLSRSDNGRLGRAVRRRRPCAVEELSNEEFNQKVEMYIEQTRTFLRKEKMADAMKESYKVIGYHSV